MDELWLEMSSKQMVMIIKRYWSVVNKGKTTKGLPTMIIAHTVKGKGVSFMENQIDWHGRAPNKEEFEKAMLELQ